MINCPVGTYNPTPNGQSVADCTPCDPGSYCLEGVSAPNGQCEPGFYCPSPIANPYGLVPANIGSYGPRMVCTQSRTPFVYKYLVHDMSL